MSRHRLRPGCALPVHGCGFAIAAAVILLAFGGSADAQLAEPKSPPAPKREAANLPSARSVVDRHIAAIGGRDAVLRHSSTHAQATLSMPAAGMSGSLEVFAAKPNKSLLRVSLGGVGEVVEGFDGTHAWSVSPMTGPMLLDGAQLEEKRFDSEYHGELRDDSRYASMTTLEQTEFEGRLCYRIRLVRKTGQEEFEFYDVETGLKAGGIATRETPMGTVTATTVETDYRRFGALLQPSTVRSQIGGLQQVITITSIEYDTVPASVFEMPSGIEALLK